jgi:hypothetical protein
MLTFLIIFACILSLYFFGIPITYFLSDYSRRDQESQWVKVPFVGLSFIILCLQNLVYLDIPITHSVPWLWGTGILLWVWFLRKGGRLFLSAFPSSLLVAGVGVYIVHGLGLIAAGAFDYVGRAWHDQFNYTATAQFMMDYPISLPMEAAIGKPYLYTVMVIFKGAIAGVERIGAPVFQAFLATTVSTAAKTAFEPAILLYPFLTFMAIFGLAKNALLTKWKALGAAMGAAILPGVAMVHLECFFAQAMAVPLLLAWPIFLATILNEPGWRSLCLTSLVLAAGTTNYTEFYPLFLGIGILSFGISVALREKHPLTLFMFGALICTSLLMNLGFVRGVSAIMNRLTVKFDALEGIYPWAVSLEGLQRLWFGDIGVGQSSAFAPAVGLVCFALILLGIAGLTFNLWRKKDAVSLATLALGTLPAALLPQLSLHKYQFYKILLSMCPLYPLGLVFLREGLVPHLSFGARATKIVSNLILAITLLFSFLGTADMALRAGTGKTQDEIGRGGAHRLLDPATIEAQKTLSGMENDDIFIFWKDDFFGGGFISSWLSYFARKNRVWLGNPLIADIDLSAWPGTVWLPNTMPQKGLILSCPLLSPFVAGSSVRMQRTEGLYSFWRFEGTEWVASINIQNPNGIESIDNVFFFWVGNKNTVIETVAGRPGVLTLQGTAHPGPSLPEHMDRSLVLEIDAGFHAKKHITSAGIISLDIPIKEGQTRIGLHVEDPPSVFIMPNGDTRPLLLQLRDLKAVAFK